MCILTTFLKTQDNNSHDEFNTEAHNYQVIFEKVTSHLLPWAQEDQSKVACCVACIIVLATWALRQRKNPNASNKQSLWHLPSVCGNGRELRSFWDAVKGTSFITARAWLFKQKWGKRFTWFSFPDAIEKQDPIRQEAIFTLREREKKD